MPVSKPSKGSYAARCATCGWTGQRFSGGADQTPGSVSMRYARARAASDLETHKKSRMHAMNTKKRGR